MAGHLARGGSKSQGGLNDFGSGVVGPIMVLFGILDLLVMILIGSQVFPRIVNQISGLLGWAIALLLFLVLAGASVVFLFATCFVGLELF